MSWKVSVFRQHLMCKYLRNLHQNPVAQEYKWMYGNTCSPLFSPLPKTLKKPSVDIPPDLGFFPGHTETAQIFTICSSDCKLNMTAHKNRGGSYIFNRTIFCLQANKLNTRKLAPTHTHTLFVSFGKFSFFTMAWSTKKMKRRREGKGRENVPTEFFSLPGASAGPRWTPV